MKKLFIVLTAAVVFLIVVFGVKSFFSEQPQKTSPVATGGTLGPQELNKDYGSRLYQTAPGKSAFSDVIKINGKPSSFKTEGEKTYFYYNTPSSDFKNLVVFENNVQLYALENIFGNYRGTFDNFLKAYGTPKTFYKKGGLFVYKIFLSYGLGVETDEKDILKIIYFVPMTESEFLQSVAKELGLSKEKPTPEVLRP